MLPPLDPDPQLTALVRSPCIDLVAPAHTDRVAFAACEGPDDATELDEGHVCSLTAVPMPALTLVVPPEGEQHTPACLCMKHSFLLENHTRPIAPAGYLGSPIGGVESMPRRGRERVLDRQFGGELRKQVSAHHCPHLVSLTCRLVARVSPQLPMVVTPPSEQLPRRCHARHVTPADGKLCRLPGRSVAEETRAELRKLTGRADVGCFVLVLGSDSDLTKVVGSPGEDVASFRDDSHILTTRAERADLTPFKFRKALPSWSVAVVLVLVVFPQISTHKQLHPSPNVPPPLQHSTRFVELCL
mmetsp:Transcript_50553/g.157853  ORF Transcript_50553/g.157853 Transcript_50553/m.157853 type:complete len:301 (+) Transcript_50553:4270-5172(+)